MTPSATTAPSVASPPAEEDADNNLQPFFVLQKASTRKSDRKLAKSGKTRRNIDFSPASTKNGEKSEVEDCIELYERLQLEAFESVWSKIESIIQGVLRDVNASVFKEIYCWVSESFKAIQSIGKPNLAEGIRSFPTVTNASSKQLYTGLVLTKNMDFVDDQVTFEELGSHLKSQGCHVAHLSSLDFSAKSGIGSCLRSLLRQLLESSLDAADISVLASWYGEQGNYDAPLVVIINDMERCSGAVLHDLICMLSEWVIKIPIILIMGVATTVDALRNMLPSNALKYLSPRKFLLGSPAERMDAVVEAVLVRQCSGFSIGHKVAVFMRNYFLNHDGTITSFIRALKIACVEHFSMEPLSLLLKMLLVEEDSKGELAETANMLIKMTFKLPSHMRNKVGEQTGEHLAEGLLTLKRLQKRWSIVVQCLYEAGKCHRIQLLDLFCEALDPNAYVSRMSYGGQQSPLLRKCVIYQVVQQVRELPPASLFELLDTWRNLTEEVSEIHERVMEVQSSLKFEYEKISKQDTINMARRQASHTAGRDTRTVNENAARLLECMVRDFLQPIECIPLYEIVCFSSADKLSLALIGDPRRKIQVDLLESHLKLNFVCCSSSGSVPSASTHDTSIMYSLAQEHGDIINLHDWYQSFKTVLQSSTKGKRKLKSPRPKKGKTSNDTVGSEASIQARFCRAVTELQIAGLLRMPSKRRPDYVQRVAFGL